MNLHLQAAQHPINTYDTLTDQHLTSTSQLRSTASFKNLRIGSYTFTLTAELISKSQKTGEERVDFFLFGDDNGSCQN